ncbi:MAG: hypothetical protein WC663_03100 [Patescibacteria group bacterium]|jgi:hypothetical protein
MFTQAREERMAKNKRHELFERLHEILGKYPTCLETKPEDFRFIMLKLAPNKAEGFLFEGRNLRDDKIYRFLVYKEAESIKFVLSIDGEITKQSSFYPTATEMTSLFEETIDHILMF